MKPSLVGVSACSISVALLYASGAWAQPAAGATGAAGSATTSAPATAPNAGAAVECVLGDHFGTSDAEMWTATDIVCGEVAKLVPFVKVNRSGTSTADKAYRFSLGRLGSSYIAALGYESPAGTIVDRRDLQLSAIEELPVAAPRLVQALVRGLPLEQTQRVDNIVSSESRRYKKKSGSTHFVLGLLGVAGAGLSNLTPAPGIELKVNYEALDFSLGGSLRAATSSSQHSSDLDYFALSIGGDYFFSQADTSPFVGGGFAWTTLHASDESSASRSANGVGAFGEVGIEFLRTHRTHLAAALRADAPFYSLRESQWSVGSGQGSSVSDKYIVPLTFSVAITF